MFDIQLLRNGEVIETIELTGSYDLNTPEGAVRLVTDLRQTMEDNAE